MQVSAECDPTVFPIPGLPHVTSPLYAFETENSLNDMGPKTRFAPFGMEERRKYSADFRRQKGSAAKMSDIARRKAARLAHFKGADMADVDLANASPDKLQSIAEKYLAAADEGRKRLLEDAKIKEQNNAENAFSRRDADEAEVCTHPALLCPSGFRIDGSDELEAGCPDCGRTVIIVAASCEEECDACTDGTASATF